MAKIRVVYVCDQLELAETEKVLEVFCQYEVWDEEALQEWGRASK